MEEKELKEKRKRKVLNVAWIICGGWVCSLLWLIVGSVLFLTYIGRDLGKQCFAIAKYAIWPHEIEADAFFWNAPLANLLWWFPFGVLLIQMHIWVAGFFCVTIIGFPIGKQYFKMALIAMSPFGIKYEKKAYFEPYCPEKY